MSITSEKDMDKSCVPIFSKKAVTASKIVCMAIPPQKSRFASTPAEAYNKPNI